jgi:hypothetical protein
MLLINTFMLCLFVAGLCLVFGVLGFIADTFFVD